MDTSPLSALIAQIEAYAESVKDKIVAFADTFVPQLITDIEVGIEDLAGFAVNAVLTEAPKIISGSEKFGNAVTNVVQTVEAQGKTVGIQTAQMAVQQAYIAAGTVAANSQPAAAPSS